MSHKISLSEAPKTKNEIEKNTLAVSWKWVLSCLLSEMRIKLDWCNEINCCYHYFFLHSSSELLKKFLDSWSSRLTDTGILKRWYGLQLVNISVAGSTTIIGYSRCTNTNNFHKFHKYLLVKQLQLYKCEITSSSAIVTIRSGQILWTFHFSIFIHFTNFALFSSCTFDKITTIKASWLAFWNWCIQKNWEYCKCFLQPHIMWKSSYKLALSVSSTENFKYSEKIISLSSDICIEFWLVIKTVQVSEVVFSRGQKYKA